MLPFDPTAQDRNTTVTLDPETQRRATNPLLRILDYHGYSIHDVVNRREVKERVKALYKISCALKASHRRSRSGRPLQSGLHR